MRGFKALNEASKQIEQVKRYSPRTASVPGACRSEARVCRMHESLVPTPLQHLCTESNPTHVRSMISRQGRGTHLET
ncbi:hypothetical protein SRHO_G00149120 [Serrasalmus rhombeus]